MKFLLILSCLALYAALTCAQECRGLPRHQDCDGGKNEGTRHAHDCTPDPNPRMWYYNRPTGECLRMAYHGCRGNSNRYCTKEHCERSCRRRD